ncbi:hypothetical protein [Methylobacterium sp. CCH5-D2]|uniref:hypothetical protein n=1 Tax=Methylobacterium sp. CCH5-D2 TaxID=1768765 RepID=UPI0008303C77|nr:hypothetical protein [Methylobacterium sp. CCH5-D2]
MPRHEIHPASGRSYADLRAEALALRAQFVRTPEIAARLSIWHGTISKWVRRSPHHAAACRFNRALKADERRFYPAGHDALRRKLAREGFDRAERIALLQRVAEARPEIRP